MQFSDTSTNQGLIQDISSLLGAMDLNTYNIYDRTRNINERYRSVLHMIFESYGGWRFIDDNSAALPYADQTLTSGTGTYTLPVGALTVNMVEILSSSGSFMLPLQPMTEEEFKQIGGDLRLVSNATPLYYKLYANQIQLIPAPNWTIANGLRVYFDQDISTFVVTDTTKTPGFAAPYHRLLSIGAAIDFALIRMPAKVPLLQKMWDDKSKELQDFYSDRFKDRQPMNISGGRDNMDLYR